MRKTKSRGVSSIVVIAAVVVIAAAFAGYHFLSASNSTSSKNSSTTNTGLSPGKATILIASGTASYRLNFSPQSIKLVVGVNNTVVWTNNDGTAHSLTFTSAPSGVSLSSLTDPDNLQAGESYTLALTVPGTYQYHCSFHSWMQGTITVVQSH